MSKLLVNQYQKQVAKIIQYGGSSQEGSIKTAFHNLLNEYCKSRNFLLVTELEYRTKSGKIVRPDGTVKDTLRLAWGYWESKDKYDNLDEEIEKKLSAGYPDDNILFEDSQTAVLLQQGEETLRVSMQDEEGLDNLINAFINYVRPEVRDFREAIEHFKEDLPTILETLRGLIDTQSTTNQKFKQARDKFLGICQESINPKINLLDVREMIIQHILTEDIFLNIFNESQFHRENNIARELQGVVETFFTGGIKRNTLSTIERYYAVICRTAASIYNHHEKQGFLKKVYEEFYKVYNPKVADRLGIVYTPNEIVRFMIESTDYLVHKHFGKLLSDSGVEILDPATGTGTFITELIEYLELSKLKYKYQNDIHCNEVAILPYYIANLNIEYSYKQKMGEYEEFTNICFVDTLKHTELKEKQLDIFSMMVENTERIQEQNNRTISVIIGNPPYNAKQENFNQNNANWKYEEIDKHIRDTYVKQGTAQNKNFLYDMYTRFIRWGADRLNQQEGILAFITNSSFLDARAFDGFRKCIQDEFSYAYFIDLGGNVRAISGRDGMFISERHTIFGTAAMTGISILFLVKDSQSSGNKIFYANPFHVHELRTVKLDYLRNTQFRNIDFTHINPDKKYNWINQSDNDFDELLPLMDKEVKAGRSEKAVFKLFSSGLKTQRDEWVYDFSRVSLEAKIRFFVDIYQKTLKDNNYENKDQIKWDEELVTYNQKKIHKKFNKDAIVRSLYRPYIQQYLYLDKHFNGRTYQWSNIHSQDNDKNKIIAIPGLSSPKDFFCLVSKYIIDLNCLPAGSQCLPLYIYDENGNRLENITDWGIRQFQTHYQEGKISKIDIFYYIYAVLHCPEYRQKYEQNLKRGFPRIPYYENFYQWVEWGQKLMELHINHETVTPYPLTRIDIKKRDENLVIKPKLKADKDKGIIYLDDITSLENTPPIAWQYKLGNRSALEWILDQYRERKPKDKIIAKKFNTYRFSDYKEKVIDLLQKVCNVSVETMAILEKMKI